MPENVTAVLMQARPGTELCCIARNATFKEGPGLLRVGLLSHYAARTICGADSVLQWKNRIVELDSTSNGERSLERIHLPALEVSGAAGTRLPGITTANRRPAAVASDAGNRSSVDALHARR